ncbi:hypothetical protein HYFRA_00001493 [Hymenoscyphus fraxineus]|uniref:Uncharacterized protein n=1 Tax=Hymenoscyphus fraxineus TaxID=746836 RepID=A0A9N9L413_9HELO|nr:hypothetical protein HYFRA_00001493 [Hymenoscyphus fraxineus]
MYPMFDSLLRSDLNKIVLEKLGYCKTVKAEHIGTGKLYSLEMNHPVGVSDILRSKRMGRTTLSGSEKLGPATGSGASPEKSFPQYCVPGLNEQVGKLTFPMSGFHSPKSSISTL